MACRAAASSRLAASSAATVPSASQRRPRSSGNPVGAQPPERRAAERAGPKSAGAAMKPSVRPGGDALGQAVHQHGLLRQACGQGGQVVRLQKAIDSILYQHGTIECGDGCGQLGPASVRHGDAQRIVQRGLHIDRVQRPCLVRRRHGVRP